MIKIEYFNFHTKEQPRFYITCDETRRWTISFYSSKNICLYKIRKFYFEYTNHVDVEVNIRHIGAYGWYIHKSTLPYKMGVDRVISIGYILQNHIQKEMDKINETL